MSGYDFLRGVRVVEVAQLGPSSLGGYLADMGAEVIKVEGFDGDPVRNSGTPSVGTPDGVGFLHLRWNRGKRSVGIDLKTSQGKALFKQLAARSDVVIEGMRAGVLDRLGLGYDVLSADNPKLVFCTLSGLGRTGPYAAFGSHGPSFDAFGGLASVNPYGLSDKERTVVQATSVGMHAMGLYAALGTLSALLRARTTGQGALIEVTGAEAAAHWRPDGVDTVLNEAVCFERPGFLNSRGRQAMWPRLWRYDTADGRGIFFQALSPKFWIRFCAVVERPDLRALYDEADDLGEADEQAHAALSELFVTRPLTAWLSLFLEHDIPAGPANTTRDLATDPHFLARDNLYDADVPGVGPMRLTTTPVKTPGQHLAPTPPPDQGADTDDVLAQLLGLSSDELASLHDERVVYTAVEHSKETA